MVLPFFYESKMGKNEIKKQVIYFTTLLVVWYDYHISLESLNPKTLNTRLNKSSLRETSLLLLFEQLLLLTSNISFKYYYYIYITIINRVYIKARVLQLHHELSCCPRLTISLVEVIKALLTYLLTFLLFKVGIFGYRKSPRERAAL